VITGNNWIYTREPAFYLRSRLTKCLGSGGQRQIFKIESDAAAIKGAGAIGADQVADQDHRNGGNRQGHQDTEETVQLSSGHDSEDNSNGMQTDAFADQSRSQNGALEQLTGDKDQHDPGQLPETVELQNRGDTRNQHPDNESQVGNEADNAGKKTD